MSLLNYQYSISEYHYQLLNLSTNEQILETRIADCAEDAIFSLLDDYSINEFSIELINIIECDRTCIY
jgi:hypothetical protein